LQQRQGCGWIAKEVSGNMPGIQEIGLDLPAWNSKKSRFYQG
jgi:hypothetical protein